MIAFYDDALWACPLCRYDDHYCVCSIPNPPPESAMTENRSPTDCGLTVVRMFKLFRLAVVDQRQITPQLLFEELGISSRTAKRYMGYLREANVPNLVPHVPRPRVPTVDPERAERLQRRHDRRAEIDAARASRAAEKATERVTPTCLCGRTKAEHPIAGCGGWWERGL